MFFSDVFHVNSSEIKEYGAIDISLVCDVPLFIDPMLIFNSTKKEYISLHKEMIRYFHFLYKKAKCGLTEKEIGTWFEFNEIPNNWLGYSRVGNKGAALGRKRATFLYKNIAFAVNTHGISKDKHIEKIMLLSEGSGKDVISDMTVNMIKGYLCAYTEEFCKKHVDKKFLKTFYIEKTSFNYDTESFVSEEFTLPYIINKKGKEEYVLLTPCDILREDEPAINRKDCLKSYDAIRMSIDDNQLRTYVNNYLAKAVHNYEEKQRKNRKKVYEKGIEQAEKRAFEDLLKEYPNLYDYYIKYKENTATIDGDKSRKEMEQEQRLIDASKEVIRAFKQNNYSYVEKDTAREEAKRRIKFFKHMIEDEGCYKNLYIEGKKIVRENDIQRLFKLVWYGTNYKVDAEVNNGRGAADFIISHGRHDQNIIEFKLASNPSLANVFKQVEVYESANCTSGSIIVIFFFSDKEEKKAFDVVIKAGYESLIDESVFLIDCRNDNKISASKTKQYGS